MLLTLLVLPLCYSSWLIRLCESGSDRNLPFRPCARHGLNAPRLRFSHLPDSEAAASPHVRGIKRSTGGHDRSKTQGSARVRDQQRQLICTPTLSDVVAATGNQPRRSADGTADHGIDAPIHGTRCGACGGGARGGRPVADVPSRPVPRHVRACQIGRAHV